MGNHAPVIPATDINLLDIGNVANAGAVKSIRQMVIESETVQKGESRKAEESEESKKAHRLRSRRMNQWWKRL